ncbi:protein O-mannosyl-transferase family [Rubrobacter aplysinae]|uniref:protein O-mannosyl-transferase family n=1 Tax=Rubrobacter aplysinae TaxID=909625 RepID=UPI001F1A25DF|nr:DUF2723 domain-containing protein [Rubrobacter aplysinae]
MSWRVKKASKRLGGPWSRRAIPPVAGAVVGAGVFVLYLLTLAPGVMHYQRPEVLDSAMLQVHAATLSITHPTGYPTWTMLTHLLTYLPPGNEAYMTNLASAIHGALAVAFVYAAAYALTRNVVASGVGALAFGLGQALWSQSNLAEIYALNALFEALMIFTLLLWRARRERPDGGSGDRYLLVACLLLGLAMTNHMTSGLLLPAGALFVFLVDRSRFTDLGLVLRGAGLFLVGLLPYAYLPIRSSMNPDSMEFDPSSPGRFFQLVSGSSLNGNLIGLRPSDLVGKLGDYAGYLVNNLNWALLALAAVGLVSLLRRDRAAAAFTGFLFAGWLIHALAYNILDVYIYFIPTYMVLSLWAATGAATILGAVWSLASPHSGYSRKLVGASYAVVAGAFVLFSVAGVQQKYEGVDRSDSDQGRRTIEAVADNVETGATVIQHRSPLWYMVLVEKRRRDLTLLDPYYPTIGPGHYDTVWPGDLTPEQAQRRYATHNDDFGVETARRAAEKGPVYILDSGLVSGQAFQEAGFDVIHVEGGILYELVPRESQPG